MSPTERQSPSGKRTRGTNPCEICRKLRRKCSPAGADSERCERCWLYGLECLYEDASTPANPEVDTYRELIEVERQFAVLESEILKLRGQNKQHCSKAETELKDEKRQIRADSPPTAKKEALTESDDFMISSQLVLVAGSSTRQIAHPSSRKKKHGSVPSPENQDPAAGPNTSWKICLTRTGLRIDTTIRTVADLAEFTRYSISNFQSNPTRPFLVPPQTNRQVLQATPLQPANTFEKYHRDFMKSVFDRNLRDRNSLIDQKELKIIMHETPEQHTVSFSVLDELVDGYFICSNMRIPLLHRPTFYKKFQRKKSEGDPLSWLLLCSICAIMAVFRCDHTTACSKGFVSDESRALLGEMFFTRGKAMIRDNFDESNPEMVIALINLIHYCMTVGQIAQAWKYMNHVSAMCQALRAELWDDDQTIKVIDDIRVLILPSDPKEAEVLIERALFKRSYFLVMLINIKMQAIFTGGAIELMTAPSMAKDLHRVVVVEDELPDIGPTIQFFKQALGLDLIRTNALFQEVKRMREGEINELSVETYIRIEQLLIDWYHNVARDFRLTSEPFEQIDPQWLQEAQPNVQAIVLALHYYLTWLSLHRHFLPPSSTTAIAPSMLPLVLRSLAICTQASTIITRLSKYLFDLNVCSGDPLALMEASDIHFRLSMSSNPQLAVLGKKFLDLDIVMMKRTFGDLQPDKMAQTLLEGIDHAMMKMSV